MRGLYRALIAFLSLVVLFASGSAVRAADTDGYEAQTPEGIEIVDTVPDIKFGDDAPKPGFKYKGKLMVEGVDYEKYTYKYVGGEEIHDYVMDSYIPEYKTGRYLIVVWGIKGDLRPVNTSNTFELCTFEVSSNTMSLCDYEIREHDYFFYDPNGKRFYIDVDVFFKGYSLPRFGLSSRYEDNDHAGTGKRIFYLTGDYDALTGELVVPFKIDPLEFNSANTMIFPDGHKEHYTGSPITMNLFPNCVGVTLGDDDFEVVGFKNNVNVGKATVTIKGKNNFTGTLTEEFDIVPEHIGRYTVFEACDMPYTGDTVVPKINATFNGKTLKEGVDYIVHPGDQKDIGTGWVTVEGIGNFERSTTVYFNIVDGFDIAKVSVAQARYSYDPEFDLSKLFDKKISYAGRTLVNGRDYTVVPDDTNLKIGKHTAVIYGKGSLTGWIKAEYYIDPCDISKFKLSAPESIYDGSAKTAFTLKDSKGRSVDAASFKKEFKNNVNAGKASVKVTGTGNYTGTVSCNFTIKPVNIADVKVKKIPDQDPGSKPELTLTYGKMTLKKDRDYKVSYNDILRAGTATVEITGVGNFTGTGSEKFTIKDNKQATPIAKPTASAKGPKALILSFVERIYTYVLDREPEAEGASFWTDELYSFRRTGAEVGLGFIFSDEFTSRGLSDGDFVTVLYRTFFGREPEEEGFKFWTGALKDCSLDRMGVANGFVYSQEWADTCASYGIRSGGGIKPGFEIEPTDATNAFVERMYTTAMKRSSDEEGKKFWANELSNFRFTGEQVGVMFFLSDEMQGFNLSNEEFVTRLYKTFMDREPEEGGFNFWVGYLNDGGSREGAVLGFTRSEEFVSKCIEARILPY